MKMMMMVKRKRLRIVTKKVIVIIFLFIFNSLSLFYYFFSHQSSSNPSSSLDLHSHSHSHSHDLEDPSLLKLQTLHEKDQGHLKPWPALPSQLPWRPPHPGPGSCEAFFGNGFSRRRDLVAESAAPGRFVCWFSETLRSSVCEGGGLRMVPGRVRVAAGGERLRDVVGRGEAEELPVFEDGAFEVDGGEVVVGGRKRMVGEGLDEFMPVGEVSRHTMRDLVWNTFVVPSKEFLCDQWIEEPTILVTRFEYANLFHTVTDWYSAYVASRVTGLPNRPHLVFVDGHCTAPLEDTWRALFSSVRYAKNFTGSVCFRHAVFAPLGYETALFKGLSEEINCDGVSAAELRRNPDDVKTARLSEFGEMIQSAFGFPVDQPRVIGKTPTSGFNVLFVRREDYLAHPRHGGKVESRLENEEEVFNAIKVWALSKDCRINVVNGLFGHMSMKEQVRAIQDAHVIVGAHGAGLTHIISASSGTVVLEIISSFFRRPHFQLIARWKGLEYHAINLPGSHANPQEVIESMNKIMKGLGC